MEIITLEQMLETLKEAMESELESEGIATWSINSAGVNVVDNLEYYDFEDLKQLQEEIQEGSRVEITIDLSEHLLDSINRIVEDHENKIEDQSEDLN